MLLPWTLHIYGTWKKNSRQVLRDGIHEEMVCDLRLFRLDKIMISKEMFFYEMVIESYLCLWMTNMSI